MSSKKDEKKQWKKKNNIKIAIINTQPVKKTIKEFLEEICNQNESKEQEER